MKEYRIATGFLRTISARYYRAELIWVGDSGEEDADPIIQVARIGERVVFSVDYGLIAALAEELGERWCSVLRDMVRDLVNTISSCNEDEDFAKTSEALSTALLKAYCNYNI